MVVGHVIKNLLCLVSLAVVMCVCIFHCNEGTRLIPRYTYGLCWLNMGMGCCLKFIFASCKCVLKAHVFSFDLLGHPMIAHLEMPWRTFEGFKEPLPQVKGHFTHEPRALTMKLWEPKKNCPKAIPSHLQNHVLWSRTLKCNVKSYVNVLSTKCYFNAFIFMQVLTDKIE